MCQAHHGYQVRKKFNEHALQWIGEIGDHLFLPEFTSITTLTTQHLATHRAANIRHVAAGS